MQNFRWVIIILTALIVALGQPVRLPALGLIANLVAYAFFWKGMLTFSKRLQRFILAFVWYAFILSIQLSWVATPTYHGWYIYLFYMVMLIFWGAQFAFLSICIPKKVKWQTCLLIPSLWVFFEWMRLYLLSGYTWNPIGLAWTGYLYPLQFASLGGIYLLSFWALLLNTLFLLLLQRYTHKKVFLYLTLVLIPFIYGWIQVTYQTDQPVEERAQVVLVQTAWTPGEKMGFSADPNPQLHPLLLWKTLLQELKKYKKSPPDLFVLPEVAIPYHAHYAIYPYQEVQALFRQILDVNPLPSADRYVSNSFIYQTLAHIFKADLITGLEFQENENYYNSLFLFTPTHPTQRYDKAILVPMGEYIPFEWARKIVARYGITSSFKRGESQHLLEGRISYLPSICYEDTFSNYIEKFDSKKTLLLVNLTNDGWFPNSTLYQQHADHARVRTVENGLPLIRATNIGITAAYDSLGRVLAQLPPNKIGSVKVDLPLKTYPTLFSFYGNFGVLFLSFLLFLLCLVPIK